MTDKVLITLGPGGMGLAIGGDSFAFPRHVVKGIRRRADGACQLLIADEDPLDLNDTAVAAAIEDWIIGSPPSSANVPITKPGPAFEITSGSVVHYAGDGNLYEVARSAHADGVKRWRLKGHGSSRGINESALTLHTPIRVFDRVVLGDDGNRWWTVDQCIINEARAGVSWLLRREGGEVMEADDDSITQAIRMPGSAGEAPIQIR